MELNLNYGKKGLSLRLPDDWEVSVLQKIPMPVLSDPKSELERSLSAPIDSPSLTEAAKNCKSACILICDITRPVPNNVILPTIVKKLMNAGLKPCQIKVLVATGLHRPNEGEELRELVGDDWVINTVEVVNHFARKEEDHINLGYTKRGTPVLLDRRFVEADLRLVIGLVEPHFMAGYSGGRKVITPGIAHKKTITRIHSAEFMEDPKTANCVIEGNPLHIEQMEIVSMLGPVLAVNTVIDEKRRISFISFGQIETSHLAAVDFMRKYSEIPISQRFKTVITTAAGYPLDKTYYQTIKGMVGAMDCLESGGCLFIASECSEGIGSPEYAESQARLVSQGGDSFLKSILNKRHADIDEWETEMQLKPMRIGNIKLFTEGLNHQEKALTGVEVLDSLERGVLSWVEEMKDTQVAVIPEGPYLIPVYRPESSS